jgi:hypothetical protein
MKLPARFTMSLLATFPSFSRPPAIFSDRPRGYGNVQGMRVTHPHAFRDGAAHAAEMGAEGIA